MYIIRGCRGTGEPLMCWGPRDPPSTWISIEEWLCVTKVNGEVCISWLWYERVLAVKEPCSEPNCPSWELDSLEVVRILFLLCCGSKGYESVKMKVVCNVLVFPSIGRAFGYVCMYVCMHTVISSMNIWYHETVLIFWYTSV